MKKEMRSIPVQLFRCVIWFSDDFDTFGAVADSYTLQTYLFSLFIAPGVVCPRGLCAIFILKSHLILDYPIVSTKPELLSSKAGHLANKSVFLFLSLRFINKLQV